MEASDSCNETPSWLSDTSVCHADVLQCDGGQAAAYERFSAPESHESDCSCDGGVLIVLDTLQLGHHGRYASESQSGGKWLRSSTCSKLGHVYHTEPSAGPLLCQPGAVRLRGREVQDEVLPHDQDMLGSKAV